MTTTKIYILDHDQAHQMLRDTFVAQGWEWRGPFKEGVKAYYICGDFDIDAVKDYYWFLGYETLPSEDGDTVSEDSKTKDDPERFIVDIDGELIRNAVMSAIDTNPKLKEAQAIMDLNEHTKSGLIDE